MYYCLLITQWPPLCAILCVVCDVCDHYIYYTTIGTSVEGYLKPVKIQGAK